MISMCELYEGFVMGEAVIRSDRFYECRLGRPGPKKEDRGVMIITAIEDDGKYVEAHWHSNSGSRHEAQYEKFDVTELERVESTANG